MHFSIVDTLSTTINSVYLLLQLFGDAAFAQTVLEGRKVEDVFAVVWGWGVAVMMGVATSGGISGKQTSYFLLKHKPRL